MTAPASTTRRQRRARPLAWIAASACTALLLSGCGAEVEKDKSSAPEVSLTNCGAKQTYPRPQKPVAYDVSAIEKMFSLGLADQMRGIVMPQTVSSAIEKSPYQADYHKVETISDGVLGQEAVVNAKADWVFAGWEAGFSEARGVTPDSLDKVGIHSFMQNETCEGYKGDQGIEDPMEALYQDLTDLGTIFGVEDRAEDEVKDLKERQKKLEERKAPPHSSKVFVYDSGTSEPYTAGRRTTMDSVIDMAGGTSVTHDLDARWATTGWESVVKAEPDAVVVVDYNKQPVEEKIDYLTNSSPLKNSPAIKNNRIYVLDYAEAVSSPRNLDAAEKLANWLRTEEK